MTGTLSRMPLLLPLVASFIAGVVFVYSCSSGDEADGQAGGTGVPAGTILAWGGPSVPSGYRLCNGAAVSRTDFASLFAAVGTAWGDGDGTSTFNLPDLRGRFLRGEDGGAGVDPDAATRSASAGGGNTGDAVGTVQGDENQSHFHVHRRSSTTTGSGLYVFNGSMGDVETTHGGGVASSGGAESRPVNAAVRYIIKM